MKFYQLVLCVLNLLYGAYHCLDRMEEECLLSDRPASEDSKCGTVLPNEDKVGSEQSGTGSDSGTEFNGISKDIKNNYEKNSHNGVFTKTNRLLRNICYSAIAYDLIGDLIPLARIKHSLKPHVINEKKKIMKDGFNVPVEKNLSYLRVKTFPTKLKLKNTLNECSNISFDRNISYIRVNTGPTKLKFKNINNTCFKRPNHDLRDEKKCSIPKSLPETVNFKTEKEFVKKVFLDNVTVHGSIPIETEIENTVSSKKEPACSEGVCSRPKYLNRNPNLKSRKKGFILESSKNTHEESVNTNNILKKETVDPNIKEGRLGKEQSSIRIRVNTCPTKLKFKNINKTGFKSPSYDMRADKTCLVPKSLSNKEEKCYSKTQKESVEKVFLDNVHGQNFFETENENTVSSKKEEPDCSEGVCSRPKRLNRNPNLEFRKKGFIHESLKNTHEKSDNTDNIFKKVTADPNIKEGLGKEHLSSDATSRGEDDTSCSVNVCSKPKYRKVQPNKQYEKDPTNFIIRHFTNKKALHTESYMEGLVDNIEGIRYILLDRLQRLSKQPKTYHYLSQNISSLLKKIDLLKNRIESLNITDIGNNILTPDEEALITGLDTKLHEVEEKAKYRVQSNERKNHVFSSALGQCAVCITVANKLHEAFNAIQKTLDLKDIPPNYLNLGDDWCENFSSSRLILNEFQRNWPNLFNGEEMDIRLQRDLINEFVEKCILYRSLIPDLQLYRHWRRYNNDMIKTLCTSDYTVEFKSCAPFMP